MAKTKPLKLYYVKREIMAENISKAMKNEGIIYSVELAPENLQPVSKNNFDGFIHAPKNNRGTIRKH